MCRMLIHPLYRALFSPNQEQASRLFILSMKLIQQKHSRRRGQTTGKMLTVSLFFNSSLSLGGFDCRVGRVGRADTMGLAISIVAAVPERVWYCTKKGYKPWLEPNKNNTKLIAEGGHTKWYEEQSLLKQIEKRLGGKKIVHLNDDMSLPASLKKVRYGQSQDGNSGTLAEVMQRVESLKPTVQVLADLEVKAQRSFLNFNKRFRIT